MIARILFIIGVNVLAVNVYADTGTTRSQVQLPSAVVLVQALHSNVLLADINEDAAMAERLKG